MKKTLAILLAGLGSMAAAQADSVTVGLPADGQPTYKNPGNVANDVSLIYGLAENGVGTYMCSNSGYGIGVDSTECMLTSTPKDNTNISETQLAQLSGVTLEMWSRGGAGGENYTMVLPGTGIYAGDTVTSLKFGVGTIVGHKTNGYKLTLGVYDTTNGTLIQGKQESSISSNGSVTLTLNTPLEWAKGYVIVANIMETDTSGYNNKSFISGINLTADATHLTETSVADACYVKADNRVTFKVKNDLSAFVDGDGTLPLNVKVSEDILTALVETLGIPAYEGVKISLTDGDLPADGVLVASAGGNVIDLDTYKGTVTLNGSYVGEADGTFMLAYVPEPATATLSLLALAGLAARRRRK